MTLPRTLPDPGRVKPYSRADAPYFRSSGFYVRIGGLAIVVCAALCVLVLRAWSIQILHGPEYSALALQQSYRTVDLAGPRGPIVDAKGRLLAGTTGRLVVLADVGALGELGRTGWNPTPVGYSMLRKLSRLSHVPVRALLLRIRRSVIRSPFAPAVVLPRPDPALAVYLSERAESYPGFKVRGQPSRSYPQGALGGEFLGLLGEVSQEQLGWKRYEHAKPGVVVGQTGVEAIYDSVLNPGFLRARLRVDSMGRIAGPLEERTLRALPTLQLTIDARIQRAAERAVRNSIQLARANGHGDAEAGAAVVMNPHTGGIYALVSVPSYNQAAAANNPAYKDALYRNRGKNPPLLNQATQGIYPTGSTFKPIVAEAALQEGLMTRSSSLLCSGSFTIGGFTFRNVEAGVYSYMSLPTALAESCDTWFYRLGDRFFLAGGKKSLGIQRLAGELSLGRPTGIDLIGEGAGILPTPAWLKRTYNQEWYEGQTINLSIGQGYLAATPLQMAVAYAALANGGTVVRPHVASAVVRGGNVKPLVFKPVRKLKLKGLDEIHQGLYMAAHAPGGTSTSLFGNFPIPVAGKTGTAEAGIGRSDHSWYASWAPAENPKVVVVVLIAHGGFGAEAAGPAALEIYKSFFRVKGSAPTG